MKRSLKLITTFYVAGFVFGLTSCGTKTEQTKNPAEGTGPVPTRIEADMDPANLKVEHPERFPLVEAGEQLSTPELNVTGLVSPDVSRQIPVPSLATGRIVEIGARLGDTVKQGQLLFKVRSTDVASAFSDYQKAVKNEQLAKLQLDRAKILFENGAAPKSAYEVAQNAEDNALVDLQTTSEHLRLLGSDLNKPSGIVEVFAPVSGVITDQQITNQAGVQALNMPAPFTISDLSSVWVVCDVYENNLSQVHLGQYADIHPTAYPERTLKARISNIGEILDPNIHTAKVRLEVPNPGLLKFGMFVTATFHADKKQTYATVPATAVLHLHDREFVYTPSANGRFKRLEVTTGPVLANNMQQVMSGLQPGTQVIANALVFQTTVEQ